MEAKLKRLDFLLSKSMTYSDILATRLKESQDLEEKRRKTAAEKLEATNASRPAPSRSSRARNPKAKGKKRAAEDDFDEDQGGEKRAKTGGDAGPSTTLTQPPFITVPLREYQLQGVQWSAYFNVSGIFSSTNGIIPGSAYSVRKWLEWYFSG